MMKNKQFDSMRILKKVSFTQMTLLAKITKSNSKRRKMGKKVVIVGGGPAGLMSAILLARKNISAVVIERSTWPIDKVCGEGVMPIGVDVLEKHDLLKFINPLKRREFQGIRYFDGKLSCAGKFLKNPGLVIRRTALSEGLYKAAQCESLIEFLPNCEFIDYHEEAGGLLSVQLIKSQTKEQVTLFNIEYLIGADGRRSVVRKVAKLEGHPIGKYKNRIGARVHLDIPPWDDHVQVWWGEGIEAYVASSSSTDIELSFAWDHDLLKMNKEVAGGNLFEKLLSHFPSLKEKLKDAPQNSQFGSWGPLSMRSRQPLEKRVVLIGDANIFFDPITGEGITLAFIQAELLSESIDKFGDELERKRYIKELNKHIKTYIMVTSMALFYTRHLFFRKMTLRLLRTFPRLFSFLLHFNMGEIRF
jgi:menaquinone-9 beta-reductase